MVTYWSVVRFDRETGIGGYIQAAWFHSEYSGDVDFEEDDVLFSFFFFFFW